MRSMREPLKRSEEKLALANLKVFQTQYNLPKDLKYIVAGYLMVDNSFSLLTPAEQNKQVKTYLNNPRENLDIIFPPEPSFNFAHTRDAIQTPYNQIWDNSLGPMMDFRYIAYSDMDVTMHRLMCELGCRCAACTVSAILACPIATILSVRGLFKDTVIAAKEYRQAQRNINDMEEILAAPKRQNMH